ncbi:hypothetical protein FCM35_KLT17449 [Carex littledalei]|uniref:Uncharacterized protein n=1 Tax=Carex littledalei TaxID=544730 RepID=A0A833RC24_9POAL|nr:hypothetical protein FCM35_KLT17449 [Carex littledalei]
MRKLRGIGNQQCNLYRKAKAGAREMMICTFFVLENFRYIKLVKKYGLEISQPGLESNKDFAYQITQRRNDTEVHKRTEHIQGIHGDLNQPPNTEFIEIMAPVFSKDAWRCVWHMIQNDLVHGWGLDFTLRKCVEEVELGGLEGEEHDETAPVPSDYEFHFSTGDKELADTYASVSHIDDLSSTFAKVRLHQIGSKKLTICPGLT